MTSAKDLAYKPKSPFRDHVPLPGQLQLKKKKSDSFSYTFPEIPLEINMENSTVGQCHYQ